MKNNIYDIAHIYMEEIFVPVCAIQNNVEFLMIDGIKTVRTADGALSKLFNGRNTIYCPTRQI